MQLETLFSLAEWFDAFYPYISFLNSGIKFGGEEI